MKKMVPRRLFLLLQPFYHFILVFWAALFYGFPARRLTVIGVTGTKGKTTAVELLREILEEKGDKVASFSSLNFNLAGEITKNERKMTMPGRMFVQNFLYRAAEKKCRYAILEVTSEGIKQFRHRFIDFDMAVMTNVSPEHIEAHGGFEKYLRAKLDLFWRLAAESIAVINRDDPHGQRFSAATAAHKVFYGKDGIYINDKRYAIRDVRVDRGGISFELGGVLFVSSLLGEFNFYNILAVVAVGLSQHFEPDRIAKAIGRVSGIPGRMEFMQKDPFAVVVDYAHTPDSLRKLYGFLKESISNFQFPISKQTPNFKTQNPKLICVLGAAGGGRDKWKRPEMGKIAAEFCDEIILTNEDPYDEDPNEIISQVEEGIRVNPRFDPRQSASISLFKTLDRGKAIHEALKSAKPGDVVIITGKGAEPWMMIENEKKIPWDDREVVKEELGKIKQKI